MEKWSRRAFLFSNSCYHKRKNGAESKTLCPGLLNEQNIMILLFSRVRLQRFSRGTVESFMGLDGGRDFCVLFSTSSPA